MLSAQERARVERFASPDAARRWAAGRAGLRAILGDAVGSNPRQVVLTRGPHGKPGLAGSELKFNKSDTGETAAVGLCESREVGLDIEHHRNVKRADRIARRFFSESEQRELAALPEDQRRAAFFDCWTVKEAVLKCDGGGLGAFPMASYSAPLDPDWQGRIGDTWWGARLRLGTGLSAAVVVAGTHLATTEITFRTKDAAAPA